MRANLLVLSIVLLTGQTAHAAANHAYFRTAGELREDYLADRRLDEGRGAKEDHAKSADYIGYVTAVADSFNDICINNGVTRGQMGAIVGKYLEAHPESWNFNAAQVAHTAMTDTYPCSAKK